MNFKLEEICRVIGAGVPHQKRNVEIKGISSIQDAGPEDICFLSNPKYHKHLESTHACAVIVSKGTSVPESVIALEVDVFSTRNLSDIASGIHPQTFIHPDAVLGSTVSIGPFAVIGAQVTIGDSTIIGPCTVIMAKSTIGSNCILYPNVTVMDECIIGNRVILHAGAVIGSDGFGFAPHEGRLHKIPQIGKVIIEDDVEIGACTCVDRAAFGKTIIEKGTKLDNLIQVGHNVRIGSNTVIAGQTGISGSTTVGSGVRLGGQVGLSGHLTIGDGASVGAQAGVTKDVPPHETVSGYPAKNHMKALRLEAALRNLPELIKKVKNQEKRILELEHIIKERS
jgi:UDP-3-O-[3-hydroxymyristoyl] glucosamine N-acyltransferase